MKGEGGRREGRSREKRDFSTNRESTENRRSQSVESGKRKVNYNWEGFWKKGGEISNGEKNHSNHL